MSTDFYMVSDTEAIHIAQVGLSGFTFYYGEPVCMREYKNFLQRNMGKALRFLPEHEVHDLIEDGALVEIDWRAK